MFENANRKGGKPMNENAWVDFRAVKSAVSMETVLGRYAVKMYRVNREHVRGKCPLPTHTSATSKLSFIVNTGKNVWSCKSDSCVAAREGKSGGNVLDFVALMEGCSIREAAEKLSEWYGIAAPTVDKIPGVHKGMPPKPAPKPKPAEEGTGAPENRPLSFTLGGVDPGHRYLMERGITREKAEFFGVGFFPGKGSMQGRVVIPIHNAAGELVAYVGRAIDGAEPKYKFPSGFHKALVLYNLYRLAEQGETVIVVEGFFGAIWLHQCGFPNVVALMGWSMSEEQEALLARFRRVALLLDGDAAGREGSAEIVGRLVHKVFVKAIDLPDAKQPDHLSQEELQRLLAGL
jgi:DNA primase